MTKLKVCSKVHLFIIISVLFIAIGMAVGTVCHFVFGGFFNYGGEFSSYKSITVTYYTAEYNEDSVKAIVDDVLKDYNPYEVSYGETNLGGEAVYKFSSSVSGEELEKVASELTSTLNTEEKELSNAYYREGIVNEGGAKNIVRAAIALSSAAGFMFIYYIFRYKLRAAFSALLSCIHNLGIYVALAAITRIPLGTEAVAIGGAVLLVTMLGCGLLFDRVKKNFKEEKYAKSDRVEVIELSSSEVRTITLATTAALAAASLVVGVFACISSLYIGSLAPAALVVFAAIACFYGLIFFTPSVHCPIDATCENILKKHRAKVAEKASAKPVKAKSAKAAAKDQPAQKSE